MGTEGDLYRRLGLGAVRRSLEPMGSGKCYRAVNAAPALTDPFFRTDKVFFCQAGQGCPFGGDTWRERPLVLGSDSFLHGILRG